LSEKLAQKQADSFAFPEEGKREKALKTKTKIMGKKSKAKICWLLA